jgi:predicted DCC family thiol-disulfide oxidoreductase YuxK
MRSGGRGCPDPQPEHPHRILETVPLLPHPVMTQAEPALTLLYDGGCPLCLREVNVLRQRDRHGAIRFVDLDDPDYDPQRWGGISYREGMARIHALGRDGTVLRDLAVFREAYRLVGLGWLYAPTAWPLIAPIVDRIYAFWASQRLKLTGRPDLDSLCSCRGNS